MRPLDYNTETILMRKLDWLSPSRVLDTSLHFDLWSRFISPSRYNVEPEL
jgi:hypothetical protein